MDKETLSSYGWIVIAVLVLSIMIALATPFGTYIATAVEKTTQGLFDVQQKAGAIAGLNLPEQKFGNTSGGGNSNETDNGIKFYQPYKMTMEEDEYKGYLEYIFHEDGAVDSYESYYENDILIEKYGCVIPAGTCTYDDKYVYIEGEPAFAILENGTKLGDPAGEDTEITLQLTSVTIKYMQFGETYVSDSPYGEHSYIVFERDGSATYYENSVAEQTFPAGTFIYKEKYIEFNGERCAVYPDGTKIIIGDYLFEIGCIHKNKELINETELYSGDVYCNDCERIISYGMNIPAEPIEIVLDSNNREWIGYTKETTNLIIPETFTYNKIPYKIIGISNYAFYKQDNLVSIIIPDTITSIGAETFRECTNLKNVTFGENSKLESIGYRAFYDCLSMEQIELPDNLMTLDDAVFQGCESLKEIHIPSNLIDIPSSTFWATGFEELRIPEGVKNLGGYMFFGCNNLTTLYLPSTITSIGREFVNFTTNDITIYYNSTIANWNSIDKNADWNCNRNAKKVICTDGVINLTNGQIIYTENPDKLISFYIDDYEYYAEEGMTFKEWTETGFNNHNRKFAVNGDYWEGTWLDYNGTDEYLCKMLSPVYQYNGEVHLSSDYLAYNEIVDNNRLWRDSVLCDDVIIEGYNYTIWPYK